MRVGTVLAPLLGLAAAGLLSSLRCSVLVLESPLSDADLWAQLKNHTLLHIGGQHRGGTTLLWGGLEGHPAVAGHRLPREAIARVRQQLEWRGGGALERSGILDESDTAPTLEGIFLQDVYPHFGLDRQSWVSLLRLYAYRLLGHRLLEGVGSYGLSPSSHHNDQHRLANGAAALELFRQWAPHWNLSCCPFLLEKSPSNARTFGMLSAMWSAVTALDARFVFITRHPVMVLNQGDNRPDPTRSH